jgi:branched-subunit amino acid transport protein
MLLLTVAALAIITYSLRLAGPALRDRVRMPQQAGGLITAATACLLVSLAATQALTQGHGFAGWARPAGVAVAGLLAVRKASFPVIVIAAAATTAVLRLCGVP